MMFHHRCFCSYCLVDLLTFVPTLRMVHYIWFSHIFNIDELVRSQFFNNPTNICFCMIAFCFSNETIAVVVSSIVGNYNFVNKFCVCHHPQPRMVSLFLDYQRLNVPQSTPDGHQYFLAMELSGAFHPWSWTKASTSRAASFMFWGWSRKTMRGRRMLHKGLVSEQDHH